MNSFVLIENGAVAQFPYSLDELRRTVSVRRDPDASVLAEHGVYPVLETEAPPIGAEQVAELAGVVPDGAGGWQTAWTVRDRTSAELAAAKDAAKALVDRETRWAFLAGFVPSSGPLAGHTLQVRDADDRTNWLTSQAAYSAAVAAGATDVEGAVFRTALNETITTTFGDGLAVLLDMAAWGRTIMQTGWERKDAITLAGSFAELADLLQSFDLTE